MALRGPRVAHKGCLRCWAEVKTSLATCLAGTLPEPVHLHPPAPPPLATESSGLGKPAAVRLQALGPSCRSRAEGTTVPLAVFSVSDVGDAAPSHPVLYRPGNSPAFHTPAWPGARLPWLSCKVSEHEPVS